MSKKNKPVDVFKFIDMSGGKNACWPFTGGLNSEGRPYISIDGKKVLAYRVAWELVNGELLGDRKYLHQCDNEVCCNPSHGKPGTHEENMIEMKTRERHGLSHHMVKVIRTLIRKGDLTYKQIADMTGVSDTTISNIANNVNYAHVKD